MKPLPKGITFDGNKYHCPCPECNSDITYGRRDHALRILRLGTSCNSGGAGKRGARHIGQHRKVSRSYYEQKRLDAIARGIEFNVTIDEVADIQEAQEYNCIMTALPADITKANKNTGSLDRIDNNKGYIPGNLQIVTVKIQMMRGSYTVDEFKEVCNLVSTYG